MADTITIDERFHGPPASGNGGYTCGMLARWIDGPAQVTLRVPPPLDRPLAIVRDGERVLLQDDDVLVAEARPAAVHVEVPAPVSWDEAQAATERYPWREGHPYPTCFVCGPGREPGDGLCIWPGPVDERALFAAPWTPGADLADDDGLVRPEFVWAALDCPGGIVTDLFGDVGRMLLGRLTADLRAPVRAGAPHVAQAWTLARDGRKLHTATALFTADGGLCGVAEATWIEVAEG